MFQPGPTPREFWRKLPSVMHKAAVFIKTLVIHTDNEVSRLVGVFLGSLNEPNTDGDSFVLRALFHCLLAQFSCLHLDLMVASRLKMKMSMCFHSATRTHLFLAVQAFHVVIRSELALLWNDCAGVAFAVLLPVREASWLTARPAEVGLCH